MKSTLHIPIIIISFVLPCHSIAMDVNNAFEVKKKADAVIDEGIELLNHLQEEKDGNNDNDDNKVTVQDVKSKIEKAKKYIDKLPDGALKDSIVTKYNYLEEGVQLYDGTAAVLNSTIAPVLEVVGEENEGITDILHDVASAVAAEVIEEQQQARNTKKKTRKPGRCLLL